MKITFRGWKREVYSHTRELVAVKRIKNNFQPIKGSHSILWENSKTAFAKVEDINLTGNFLLEIEFDHEEIENWLSRYVQENPEQAIRLLSKMKGEAIINMANSNL